MPTFKNKQVLGILSLGVYFRIERKSASVYIKISTCLFLGRDARARKKLHSSARTAQQAVVRRSIFQPIGGVYIFIHQLSAANSFSWLYFRRPRAYSPAVYKTRHHLLPSIRPVRSFARSLARSLASTSSSLALHSYGARFARVITARSARIIFAARLFLHSCAPHNKTLSTERDKADAPNFPWITLSSQSVSQTVGRRNGRSGGIAAKVNCSVTKVLSGVFFQQLKRAHTKHNI